MGRKSTKPRQPKSAADELSPPKPKHSSAIRADLDRQNHSVVPIYWYIDEQLRCADCGNAFNFSANEKQFWYEELGFIIDSKPKRCVACRGRTRRKLAIRQEYERDISAALKSNADIKQKKRMVEIIEELCSRRRHHDEEPSMTRNYQTLVKQIQRAQAATERP